MNCDNVCMWILVRHQRKLQLPLHRNEDISYRRLKERWKKEKKGRRKERRMHVWMDEWWMDAKAGKTDFSAYVCCIWFVQSILHIVFSCYANSKTQACILQDEMIICLMWMNISSWLHRKNKKAWLLNAWFS